MAKPHNAPHSANLRAEIVRAGMTLGEVAAMLGMHQPELTLRVKSWAWREGDLEKIAERCGVDVDMLAPEYRPVRTATG